MKRTMGSLTAEDVGKKARYQEDGLLVSGELASVEHLAPITTFKTGTETKVTLKPDKGSRVYITRTASTEIEVEK